MITRPDPYFLGALSSGLGNVVGQLVGNDPFSVGEAALATVAGTVGGVASIGARLAEQGAMAEALTGGLATAETQGIFDFGRAMNERFPSDQQCHAR